MGFGRNMYVAVVQAGSPPALTSEFIDKNNVLFGRVLEENDLRTCPLPLSLSRALSLSPPLAAAAVPRTTAFELLKSDCLSAFAHS